MKTEEKEFILYFGVPIGVSLFIWTFIFASLLGKEGFLSGGGFAVPFFAVPTAFGIMYIFFSVFDKPKRKKE